MRCNWSRLSGWGCGRRRDRRFCWGRYWSGYYSATVNSLLLSGVVVVLKSIATMCLLTPLFAGCQFSGAAGQIEQQLPGVLTASETIAVNTLILRYQELQRLKMVLDGLPVPQLPPLPAQSPVPVVIVPPPTQPPVVVPPVSSSPPANLPLRQKK